MNDLAKSFFLIRSLIFFNVLKHVTMRSSICIDPVLYGICCAGELHGFDDRMSQLDFLSLA